MIKSTSSATLECMAASEDCQLSGRENDGDGSGDSDDDDDDGMECDEDSKHGSSCDTYLYGQHCSQRLA